MIGDNENLGCLRGTSPEGTTQLYSLPSRPGNSSALAAVKDSVRVSMHRHRCVCVFTDKNNFRLSHNACFVCNNFIISHGK